MVNFLLESYLVSSFLTVGHILFFFCKLVPFCIAKIQKRPKFQRSLFTMFTFFFTKSSLINFQKLLGFLEDSWKRLAKILHLTTFKHSHIIFNIHTFGHKANIFELQFNHSHFSAIVQSLFFGWRGYHLSCSKLLLFWRRSTNPCHDLAIPFSYWESLLACLQNVITAGLIHSPEPVI